MSTAEERMTRLLRGILLFVGALAGAVLVLFSLLFT